MRQMAKLQAALAGEPAHHSAFLRGWQSARA